VGVVLQCLEWDFEYTTANVLHVDASIEGCCGQCEELLCTRVIRRRTKAILTIQCAKRKMDNMDACMCETK
jgi:hypothetical protein